MSQILEPQVKNMSENIIWLRLGNKYLEHQYIIENNWGTRGLIKKQNFDNQFSKEYTFILDNIKPMI